MKNKKKLNVVIISIVCVLVIIGLGLIITNLTKKPKSTKLNYSDTNQSETGDSSIRKKSEDNHYVLTIDTSKKGVEISDIMYGLFYEDINFAADGGIYAELIKNRSFEYTTELAKNGALHGYTQFGDSILEIKDTDSLNENNTNYLELTNQSNQTAGFTNSGFLEGMPFTQDESYRFSVYLKSQDYKGGISVKLLDRTNQEIGTGSISNVTKDWVNYTIELKAGKSIINGKLLLAMEGNGTLNVDMVSLFPVNTYKKRENGLRADLVELLVDLKPSFLRFPGGCIVEGDPLTTAYRWKDTIGDVSERKQNTNLWIGTKDHPYYQSYGLGFYEYFLLSEDLGAKPVPIVNVGLSCQARSGKQSKVLASDVELQEYIQDALDLIEFCNGDLTTKWGGIRGEMGHPKPFNLEYLGIGNEQWDAVYFNRYKKFVDAIRTIYPDIKLITSSGPASSGHLFDYAWNTLSSHKNDPVKFADLIDEHYYNSADWFLSNADRYDSYDRDSVDVFLGEYAAKSNKLYAAVAEAAFMTGLERNGDVVKMVAYAPLFGNLISKQWVPDMIYFNNSTAFGSINYYVQKMFSTNVGTHTIDSTLDTTSVALSTISGKVGLGTWLTSSIYDDVKVVDNTLGTVIYESDFSEAKDWKNSSEGNWVVSEEADNFVYGQSNVTYPTNGAIMGSASYLGQTDWTNYTYTLRAKKLKGAEGFLIPFAVKDADNFYHWNIGGWGNTQTCVEQAQGGSKSIVSDTKNIMVNQDQWYNIKIEVNPESINCYLDKVLVHTIQVNQLSPVYETVSKDEVTGDIIIKIVNAGEAANLTVNLNHIEGFNKDASLQLLSGTRSSLENTLLKPELVIPIHSTIQVGETFSYASPAYSVSIIRIPTR